MSKKKSQAIFLPPELPCTGVESHAHLNHKQYLEDLDDVLTRARCAGVRQIGQVFLSPEHWHKHKHRFLPDPDIFFLMGIHPTEVHLFELSVLDEVQALIETEQRIRAVGEIGLDYYWKEAPPERQREFFIAQLRMAKNLDMPVAIHCRDAEEDTFEILEQEAMHGHPLLWHCFGGAPAMAQRVLGAGWHISIPGTVTFPANHALRESVAMIPEDRLMVETDCPYLTPVPFRGKRNEPAYLAYTIAVMAEYRGVTPEALWTQCGNNARRFFKLAPC